MLKFEVSPKYIESIIMRKKFLQIVKNQTCVKKSHFKIPDVTNRRYLSITKDDTFLYFLNIALLFF